MDTLTDLQAALLADFDDPDLTGPDIARRHGLTLEQLRQAITTPAFRRAVEILTEIRNVRRPLILARAEADAARTLTALTARDATSATAAKEIRLAVKDLLALLREPPGTESTPPADRFGAGGYQPQAFLGAGGYQPPDRAQPDAPTTATPHGGAGFQPAFPPPPASTRKPPARPAYKRRPKPVSR